MEKRNGERQFFCCCRKVVSFEAPEVAVAVEDDGKKLDPTEKLVVYGNVVGQSTSYDLLWTQVRDTDGKRPDADSGSVEISMCCMSSSPGLNRQNTCMSIVRSLRSPSLPAQLRVLITVGGLLLAVLLVFFQTQGNLDVETEDWSMFFASAATG